MAPSLSSLRLPEADHESPGLVDVRARVLAVDTTSEDGVVVCWLWDGTDVAPLPENATCPPAIHQGEPIREPERRGKRRRRGVGEEEEGGEAADDDDATAAGGPIPRPVPLRSDPGVQVMSAPTVMSPDQPGGDVVMERPLLMAASASSPQAASSAAAAAASRMLTSSRFPPVGSAVPLIILPVMSGSRVHGGQGQQQQQQQQRPNTTTTSTTTGSLVPRLDAASLPAPGAWVKLRHLALQVAPGGELQLLYGTPSKMSIVPAPGSAGDGAAPHLELRLAERLAAGEAAPWASPSRGGAIVAVLTAEEVEKAVQRRQEIEAAVREHAGAVAEAVKGLLLVGGGAGGGGGEEEDSDSENAPPPPAAVASRRQPKAGSSTTTPKPIPLITLRQLLSAPQRLRACRDAAALAARDEADGYLPRGAYFTRAVRLVVRLASLQPTDLVQWARPVPGHGQGQGQQQAGQQKWVLCGRAALADGTVAAASPPGAVEAFVAPETSEALLGVDAGPLDGRDARSRDRLARLAASVARLQAVGPAPKERTTGAGAGLGGGDNADADDDDSMLLLVEPTAWVEALIVPRVQLPSQEEEDDGSSFWRTDYLLTGARLLSEEEVEEARRRGTTAATADASASASAAALAAAVRDAVASAQLEAARRRAGGGGSSPAAAAAGAGRRALPAVQEVEEQEGEEDGDGGGRGKRRRR